MLPGFEEQTKPLTDYEADVLLPLMVQSLARRVGEKNAITNKLMREGFKKKEHKVGDARIRKLIHHIRIHSLVPFLMASSKGYWVEEDNARYVEWIKSLHGRVRSIQKVANAAIKDLSAEQQQELFS